MNERNKSGWSPLRFALRNGATQAGRKLIEAGADRERPTSDGFTPLMLALRNDQGENARLLLVEKGVDLDTRNQDGWTPLMTALRYEQAERARLPVSRDPTASTGSRESGRRSRGAGRPRLSGPPSGEALRGAPPVRGATGRAKARTQPDRRG